MINSLSQLELVYNFTGSKLCHIIKCLIPSSSFQTYRVLRFKQINTRSFPSLSFMVVIFPEFPELHLPGSSLLMIVVCVHVDNFRKKKLKPIKTIMLFTILCLV